MSNIAGLASAGDGAANATFDGFYLGLGLGLADADGNTEYPVIAGGTTSGSYDPGSGRAYNAFVGYNHQNGPFVYGAEIRYSNLTGLNSGDAAAPEVLEITTATDIRGRVGYVTGDFLVYGTLGWSWASLRVHPGAQFGGRQNTADLDGLNYGLGVEYSINDRWSAGADLTLRDLDGSFDEATTGTDTDLNTLTFRLGYRF